jgi:signal transduction histidine kinase
LLSVEYIFPDTVPQTYPDRLSRFLDWGTTGIITLVFVYTVSNFLRQYYDEKRLVADERAKAIENQNKVLEKVNTEKDKIFSIISHDLKAPLDSIQDYLTLLSEFALENDDRIKIETELLEQTKYTSDLLSNLMQWARSQVNGISPQIIGIVLADFLNDVVSRKQQIASKKKINITCDIPKDIIVACDFDLLQIIIRNLINNGIKFTPFGGTINISAHISASEGVISITDTGIGIAEDQQSDLFTLRTRSTYGTNNEKGIGIGLYICNEFVNAQGGRLWVESVVGNGSTFNVALPLITKI